MGEGVKFVEVSASMKTLKERRPELYARAESGLIDWVGFEPCGEAIATVDTDKATVGAAAVYVLNAMDGTIQGPGDIVRAVMPKLKCTPCNRRRLFLNGLAGPRGLK
jgi:hypothetical protein